MLPVVDAPAVQYVVEEAVAAGIDDILLIVGRDKDTVENHFGSVPELESALAKKGDGGKLDGVQRSSSLADIHFTRQGSPRGLGNAVSKAHAHVGARPFALLLGDDLLDETDPILPAMLAEHARTGASILALMEVGEEAVGRYGIATVEQTDTADVVRVRSVVEKPSQSTSSSHLAVIGRYVLNNDVFEALTNVAPDGAGEIQLTPALDTLAHDPDGPGALGVHFPWPPMGHRQPRRLHQGRHRTGRGAPGHRAGVSRLVEGLRRNVVS